MDFGWKETGTGKWLPGDGCGLALGEEIGGGDKAWLCLELDRGFALPGDNAAYVFL